MNRPYDPPGVVWPTQGGGRQSDEKNDARAGGVQAAFVSQLLNLQKGRALVGRETRQKVGWQKFRPASGYVVHGGVARGLGLVFRAQSACE